MDACFEQLRLFPLPQPTEVSAPYELSGNESTPFRPIEPNRSDSAALDGAAHRAALSPFVTDHPIGTHERVRQPNVHQARARLARSPSPYPSSERFAASQEWPTLHTDALTNVLDRRGLLERLQVTTTEPGWVVAYLDVDRFKSINDSGGHSAGDEALRNVADTLITTAAPGSIIGRLGGDEFVVASPMTVHPVVVGERIREGIQRFGGRPTVSIGITRADRGESVDALLNKADMALRRAKRLGRNRVIVFDKRLEEEMHERQRIIGHLHWAINHDAFSVDIQPIWHTTDGSIAGGECLVRMGTPDGERLRPKYWLPLAEEIGLISAIDGVILEKVAAILATIARIDGRMSSTAAGTKPLFLSVNLSPASVAAGDLSARVERVIRDHGLSRGSMVLEVSERTVPSDLEEALPVLHRLRQLGVIISLDDFGSGHASLIQVRDLPLDMIKLDRRFALSDRSGTDVTMPEMRAIAGTAVSLARALNRSVVFEGVESEVHLQIAKEVGARFCQGYHLARPMSVADFCSLVELLTNDDAEIDLDAFSVRGVHASVSIGEPTN